MDGELESLGLLGYIDLFTLDASTAIGEKWHSTGSLLYVPIDHGIDILDGNSGTLRERVSLPDPTKISQPPATAPFANALLLDSTGQHIALLTQSGLTWVELDEVPLGIGSVTPSFGTPGTVFTLRGSGFTVSTKVTVGAAAAGVSFIDSDTLQVTAPQNSNGPARISVTSANGDGYSLDAAFNYGSAPAMQHAQGNLGKPSEKNAPCGMLLPASAKCFSGRRLFFWKER